jgi:AI-2 transport protein TqsA
MAETAPQPTGSRISPLQTMALVVVVVAGLKLASAVLIPVLLALFLTIVCMPPVNFLRRRGLPSGLAIPLVILGLLIVLSALLLVVGNSISEFTRNIGKYQESLDGLVASARQTIEGMGIDLADQEVNDLVDTKAMLGFVASVATSITATLSDLVIVLLVVVFMMLEGIGLPDKLRRALGNPDDDLASFRQMLDNVYTYLSVKTVISLLTGFLAWLLCTILGVDFPVLWGLVAFLFNYIPNIGSILSAIPPVLLCLIQHGPGPAAVLAGGYLAMNMAIGNLLEPRMMGQRLGLSELVVMLSLIFWSWLWGPLGMFLSVPLTTVLKIILEHSESFRPMAILLGPSGDAKPPDDDS